MSDAHANGAVTEGLGFVRLVTFCDAVVAIAITLLILPLVNAGSSIGTRSLGDFFAANGARVFAFALSFVVIGNFWLIHHRMYERTIGYTLPLLWANLLWLISIVFLPFPTEFLGSAVRNESSTYALYIGTMVVTTTATFLQQWLLTRSPDLQDQSVRGTLTIVPAAITAILMVVALILATTTALGLWALILPSMGVPVERLVDRIRRARAASRGV